MVRRGKWLEAVRALVVLTLAALFFVHQPAPSVGLGWTGSAGVFGTSLCTQSDDQHGQGEHAPCAACRLAGQLDLPPAPCATVPAFGPVGYVAYEALPETLTLAPTLRPGSPRAPPLAA